MAEVPLSLVGEQNPPAPDALKPPRKRRRIVISCIECHRRKQKCDRASPCSNCVARKKESFCHYENESARKQQLLEESTGHAFEGKPMGVSFLGNDPTTEVSAMGYTKGDNGATTMGFYDRIERYGEVAFPVAQKPPSTSANNNDTLQKKYKALIRQLPAREYIEKLVAAYFRDVNCQYYPLDEDVFREHLQRWYDLPLSTLNEGPMGLTADLRFLPALLFQMLALALQYQPPDHDPTLNCLKYAGGMSLDDLASDYSDSGIAISTLLGKRHTSLVAVQAGFLRTSYLKNSGLIPESWHSLSQTIRDAQEIGLHKKFLDRPSRDVVATAEETLDNLWAQQLRRRMWATLTLWDINMAIILGRPSTVDSRYTAAIIPIDAPAPKSRRTVAPSPRTNDDPPTPLTALVQSLQMAANLWEVYSLEREDSNQNQIARLERIEKQIDEVAMNCPPCLRSENPDTRFDSLTDCYWIPAARCKIRTEIAFTTMALHRPYIFTNAFCRTTTLTASLNILQAQRDLFSLLNVKDYKMCSLVITTFDAIVLVAAVYIMYPNDNKDQLNTALQHFEWGMERFQALSGIHNMAQAALGVLKAIYARLKKAVNLGRTSCLPPTTMEQSSRRSSTHHTPSTSSDISNPIPTPGTSTAHSGSSQHCTGISQPPTPNGYSIQAPSTAITSVPQYTQPTISNLTSPTPPPDPAWERFSDNIPNSSSFDYPQITTLNAMHDLIYNDLSTISDPQVLDPQLAEMDGIDMDIDTSALQFGGAFANDSFWGFMNCHNV